ncbi:spermine oxidase isoform X2 [Phlebotomus papatasi]|uniref:spermine oxidase isoform X2 n=1 Tax=Phlebotomus papatasi TaxID=29031 RepID=UPI00248460B9|nr:spermine oxidase isoform X2 [Phlebotomus papatasi]
MNAKIVVIGAGASGISAASRLLKNKFTNVVILEAEDRIGGRVFTEPFGNNVVDLGAQWCHGEKNNVVYEMASPKNLLEAARYQYDRTLLIQSNGRVIDDNTADLLMALAISTVELYKDEIAKQDGSLGTFIVKKFNECLKEDDYKNLDPVVAEQFLDFFHKYENSIEASDTWFDTSARGYLEYWDCEGERLLNWRDKGYRTVFSLITDGIPIESFVKFRKTVTNISWSREQIDSSVIVKCQDGSSYTADHVIVTTSLGVLKENYHKMFSPSLPPVKRNAIEGMSIGTVDKIFIEFDKPFWTKDWLGFALLWHKTDLEELRKSEMMDWLEDIFGFYVVDYQPNVLCGWISGVKARKMERDTDENVKRGVMYLLNKFLKKNIPEPVAVRRSQWYSNPNFRGSYSFRSITTDLLNTSPDDLAKPLTNSLGTPVVCFAGEATHPHYYSTVHGAIESGWREAQRLIDLYKKISEKSESEDDVIVLGAGLAGIGATLTLQKAGFRTSLIEAKNQPGGRIRTVPMESLCLDNCANPNDKVIIEAGAQWLHGKQNQLYMEALEIDVLSHELSDEGLGSYTKDDGRILDDFFVKMIDFKIGEILEECETFYFAENLEEFRNLSVEEFLREKFEKSVMPSIEPDKKEDARLLLEWHIRFQVIDNACLKLSEVSARDWGQYSFNGENCQTHINFKNGFGKLINSLVSRIPSNSMEFNCEVIKIDYGGDLEDGMYKVRIETADGRVFKARHCIITFSLGVLKASMKTLFEPQLPGPLQSLIEAYGFGTINKIYLKYENPWWDNDWEGVQFIYNDEMTDHWTRDMTGFDLLKPGAPNTLIGWIGGEGAIKMECLPDASVIEECTNLLRKFTGKNVPYPSSFFITRWNHDPFIRGAYSFTSVSKCLLRDNCSLTEPLPFLKLPTHPALLFAGEACHAKYFSTAHGAFASGCEQAAKLVNFYANKFN